MNFIYNFIFDEGDGEWWMVVKGQRCFSKKSVSEIKKPNHGRWFGGIVGMGGLVWAYFFNKIVGIYAPPTIPLLDDREAKTTCQYTWGNVFA